MALATEPSVTCIEVFRVPSDVSFEFTEVAALNSSSKMRKSRL